MTRSTWVRTWVAFAVAVLAQACTTKTEVEKACQVFQDRFTECISSRLGRFSGNGPFSRLCRSGVSDLACRFAHPLSTIRAMCVAMSAAPTESMAGPYHVAFQACAKHDACSEFSSCLGKHHCSLVMRSPTDRAPTLMCGLSGPAKR